RSGATSAMRCRRRWTRSASRSRPSRKLRRTSPPRLRSSRTGGKTRIAFGPIRVGLKEVRVRHAVSINAPVEQAFAYFDHPENSLALIPSLVEVTEVAPLDNGGHRLRFVALGRRGRRCHWESEQTDRVPNRLVVVHAHTEGMSTTATRRFERATTGTRLETELEGRGEGPRAPESPPPRMGLPLRRPMRKQLNRCSRS